MSIRLLTPELAKKAHENCQDDPDKLQDTLQQIKDWLALQPHLNARTDDQWLSAYIRGFQFNLEKIKLKLDLYYTCRHTASDFFQMHHKDAKFKKLVETGFYLPLPKLSDPAGPRVSLIRTGVFDIEEVGIVNAFSVAHIIDKILVVDDDNAIIGGYVTVVDVKNTELLPLLHLTSAQTRMLFDGHLDALPFTTHTTIYINVPPEFNMFLNVMKFNDNTKPPQMFIYTENYEEMYTSYGVSKEIMPVEYGGNGGTVKEITDHWVKKIEEYSEWLEEDLQFGTDESKRPGKPKTAENMFGESNVKSIFKIFKSDCLNQ